MLLGLETFSYHLAFAYGRMDILAFIERTHKLGLDGVQINIEGANMGHLGSDDPGFLRDVRKMIDKFGMFVEIDTCGTNPENLTKALNICKILGADTIRVYASVGGNIKEELKQAPGQLRQVLPLCIDYGIKVAFENHEYETSQEVLQVVHEVNSEYVGTHVDTGNSMMVWEDPSEAVKAMAPYAVSTHFKDHLVIMVNNCPYIVGVPLGKGSMDCAECFRILAEESTLRRINIEVCYGYISQFSRPQELGCGAKLGEGAFVVQQPPYAPALVAPHLLQFLCDGQELRAYTWQDIANKVPNFSSQREELLLLQDEAVVESVNYVKELNKQFSR